MAGMMGGALIAVEDYFRSKVVKTCRILTMILGLWGGARLVSMEQHPYMRRNIMVQMKDIRLGQQVVGLAQHQD